MPEKQASALNVFLSYAPGDRALLNEFKTHLGTLRNQGIISCWDGQEIPAGENKEQEISRQLEAASMFLLLASPDYFASAPCRAEMEQALQRQASGECQVIPILLRPCDWKGEPVEPLQVLPRSEKAITSWPDRDVAFQDVVQDIRQAIDSHRARAPHPSPS